MSLQDQEVTADDLAGLFRVSRRRIDQLAQQGTLSRVARGRFRLVEAVHALLDELAEREGPSELQAARLAKLEAEAGLAQLELAKARGEVALVDEFHRVQAARHFMIQTNVLRVPQRAVLQLLGESREDVFKAKLRAELIQALVAGRDADLNLEEPPTEEPEA